MDHIIEIVALSIDAIVFGVCFNEYIKHRIAIKKVHSAPFLEINEDLREIVQTHPDKKLPYVIVRGIVKPIGSPIISTNNEKVTGVVQSLSIREHVVQRSTAGFWSDHERIIHEVHNFTPFALESNGYQIEVLDPLAAKILDMDIISNQFNPNNPGVMDHLWAFFVGFKQKGVQTTEKMLRINTLITGIGELVTSNDGRIVRLQPPKDSPYYLTNMQVSALIRKLEGSKNTFKTVCLVCSAIGLVVGGFLLRDYLRKRRTHLEEMRQREELAVNRRNRRTQIRDVDVPEIQICVVCKVNPREIILLPCGHVCLCEDCSSSIDNLCPVCRRQVDRKAVAYIA